MKVLPATLREPLHELYKKAEIADHQLLYLFFEITKRCNLICKHCGSDCSATESAVSLTTESWLKLIENTAQCFEHKPVINLTGGEPLLHEQIELICTKLAEHNFRWGIVSNGYVVDKKVMQMLIDNKICSMTISLDGTNDNHNWLRGKGDSFSKALNAIELAVKSGVDIVDVVTCVNPRNIDELDSVAKLLLDRGVHSWRLFRIFPAGRASVNWDLQLSVIQTRKMLDWIQINKDAFFKKGLDLTLSCEGWLPFTKNDHVRNQPFFCRSGINIASILHDGTITGCSNNSSLFYEGNVLNDNLEYLWEHGFTKFRKREWIKQSLCIECDYVKRCQGGSIHLWRDTLESPAFCYMDCFDEQAAC